VIDIPWDIAMSRAGDLLFASNRDLDYVDGIELINQRIITRLRMLRGSWLFDEAGTLGSRLDLVLSEDMPEAEGDIDGLVREALDPIRNEIQIRDIHIIPQPLDRIQVIVDYLWLTPDVAPLPGELIRLSVTLP
jgi:hypothetical protein